MNNHNSLFSIIKVDNSIPLLFFVLTLITCAYVINPSLYANSASRYYTIISLVDNGTFAIDKLNPSPMDDVSFYSGHYYSNKAFGASIIGMPVYWLMQHLHPTPPLSKINRYVIRLFASSFFFAISGVLMLLFSRKLGASLNASIKTTYAYCFGTICIIHATLLSGHITSATLSFASFYLLFNLDRKTSPSSGKRTALSAGLLAGLGALCDFTAMYTALVLTCYALSHRTAVRNKILFLIGGAICMIMLGAYNWHIFGSPWSFSYVHMTNPYYGTEHNKGLFGISLPSLHAAFQLLFSPGRGLFFIMPVLLLALPGLKKMWDADCKAETITIIAIAAGYFGIISSYYGWQGGWTFGPRYLTPIIIFLALPIAYAANSPWFRILLFLSLLQVIPALLIFSHVPESVANPLIEIILPMYVYGFTTWNLGNFLGIADPWSFLPIIIFVALLAIRIFYIAKKHSPKESNDKYSPIGNSALIILAGFILFSLLTVSTPPQVNLHCLRARLMNNIIYWGGKGDRRAFLVEQVKCHTEAPPSARTTE